jgi:hypothetical protein
MDSRLVVITFSKLSSSYCLRSYEMLEWAIHNAILGLNSWATVTGLDFSVIPGL